MDPIIIFLAKYLIFIVVILAVVAAFYTKNNREYWLGIIIAGFLAIDMSILAGWLYHNPRPFVVSGTEPLISHGPDNGFPSQHTLLAMTLTSVVYFYRRRLAAAMFLMTLLVGAGRIWADVHSWLDIAGGLAIGAIAGYAGVKLAKFLLLRLSARRLTSRR